MVNDFPVPVVEKIDFLGWDASSQLCGGCSLAVTRKIPLLPSNRTLLLTILYILNLTYRNFDERAMLTFVIYATFAPALI